MLRARRRPLEPELDPHPRRGGAVARWFRRGPARGRRALLVSAAVLMCGGLVGLVSFGPLVRSRVAREGERRNLEVEVGTVTPGFFALRMGDVVVRPRGVPGVEARIEEVEIDLGASFGVREVRARGGGVVLEGEPEELVERLRAFRGESGSSPTTSGAAPGRTVAAEDLSVVWKIPSGGELKGAGIRAARDERGIVLGCATCSASYQDFTVELTGAEVELSRDGAPRRIEAAALAVSQKAPPPLAAASSGGAAPGEPSPPPLPWLPTQPAAAPRGKAAPSAGGSAKSRAAAVGRAAPDPTAQADGAPPPDRVLPLPDLHALRARVAAAVAALSSRLPEGAKIDIAGFFVKLNVGGEPVAVGPGALVLSRSADRVHIGFASAPPAEGGASAPEATPLSIDAELPIGPGEITARLSGGPVSLAVLGVQEGMKGLIEVSRGTVSGKGTLTLSPQADALTFDGQVALRSIALEHRRLSPEPVRGLDFSVSARGTLDDAGRLSLDEARLDMGALHVSARGTLEESAEHFALSLGVDVAPAACQALLDSAPEGLLPTVRATRMSGVFGANVNVAFDTRSIDKLELDYRVDDGCKMTEVPRELSRDRFLGAFTHRTYRPDGTLDAMTTGPGSEGWTHLEDISPFMTAAVLTTEDGAFFRHKGFNHGAIRSSVQANLRARRFVRGASTITMQLAKNLFLTRDKALSRKIEEVILTDYLEQVFRKDEMMELYLNVIEFGPDVYGVTAAADYYFGRRPMELNVSEAFFLASLLPSPVRYGKLKDRGEISDRWARHLRTLMEIAARNDKITGEQLEAGLGETVVFLRPGDPRPEPRLSPHGSDRGPSEDDDGGWRPLD